MTYNDKRKIAKGMFIQGSYTQKYIASMVGCAQNTLTSWIEKGSWKDEKEAKSITRPELLKTSYLQLAAINKQIEEEHNGIPTKDLSYAKSMIRQEIQALSDVPLHQYIEVFNEYTQFINDAHPGSIQEHTELMSEFIEELVVKRNIN